MLSQKHAALISLLCVAAARAGPCFGRYTFRECPEDIDDSVEIPCESTNEDACVLGCQFTCSLRQNCSYFSYDFTEQQCQLFSEPDYLSRCNVVVGRSWDDDITVSNCTEPSQATCDSFVSAGVTFSQDPIQAVQVDTADQCLEALKVFSTFQSVFWFEFLTSPPGCLLYEEGAVVKSQGVVMGPVEPSLLQCTNYTLSTPGTAQPTASQTTTVPTQQPTRTAPQPTASQTTTVPTVTSTQTQPTLHTASPLPTAPVSPTQ